ncbi:mitochondrial inner membrane protein required for protein import [Batrachochytrium dendrobatidis]
MPAGLACRIAAGLPALVSKSATLSTTMTLSTCRLAIRSARSFPIATHGLPSNMNRSLLRHLSSTACALNNTDKPFKSPQNDTQSKENPAAEQPTGAEGMDLFAQAMAAQKLREQKQSGKKSDNGAEESTNPEDIEAERIRRLNESTQKEDNKRFGDNVFFYSGVGLASLAGMYAYMGMSDGIDKNKEGENILEAHNRRVWNYLVGCYKYWTEPSIKKLLPDPLPEDQQAPFTLLIEHNDALLHLIWDKSEGWRAALRPGAKHFMANMRKYFEVVIFTSTPGYLSQPVLEAFDPNYYAPYRLYREHTTLENGERVKDLSILNRDLSKVIIIDTLASNYRLQPENGITIQKWHGEAGDNELNRMETFLEEFSFLLAISQADDVRPFLKTLRDMDGNIPNAWDMYKQKLRKLTSEKDQTMPLVSAEDSSPKPAQNTIISFVGSLIGLNKPLTSTAAAVQTQPSFNLVDMIERLAKEERVLLVKQLEDEKKHIAEMQKLQEEMIKKQTEENKANKLTMFDAMMGAGQPQITGQPPLHEPK